MSKRKEELKDRGLVSLPLSLPNGGDSSLVDLNPQLAYIKFFSRRTNKIDRVFPGLLDSDNMVSAEYAIRVGWFDSPHRHLADFRERCLDSARACGILNENQTLDDADTKTGKRPFGKAAILFKPNTLTRVYLLNFLEYQKHPIWEFYNKIWLLFDKQYDYYDSMDLKSFPKDELVDHLKQLQSFSLSVQQQMLSFMTFHRMMVYQTYSLDELKKAAFESDADLPVESFSSIIHQRNTADETDVAEGDEFDQDFEP